MKRPQVRGIFFDLGNVLVTLDTHTFIQKIALLTGLETQQLRAGFYGDLVPRYECGLLSTGEFLAELCRRLGVAITQDDFTDAWTSLLCKDPLVPENLLRELAREYPLWAISNTNEMHFDFIRRHYRFLGHFKGWVLSYEVGAAKPDPAIFIHAMKRAGIAASEALFIDDQKVNVEAARALGMDSIHFVSAARLLEELQARGLVSNRGKD